ncbi:hypothetical protein [Nitrosospira multiformis]|uniref:Uncharacterized protein n=1 Tax=Nitrosospira multiformis TaxID=1231 RepID=A0A1I7IWA2_9PROT|nr:hypothetical protein [Nitrosospira multiformis]SFU77162.1 hypothetical protein SAMN05216417_1292 [Nitrosospira multiformis]
MSAVRGLLARVRTLERSRSATADMLPLIESMFDEAIAQGQMCGTDGPIIKEAVLRWLRECVVSGVAGHGPLNECWRP